MTHAEFSSEELAKLTAAGFVKNEQGDWVLPMLATKDESKNIPIMKFESATGKQATGVLIAMPGSVDSLLGMLLNR